VVTFPQKAYEDAQQVKLVSIGQTRDGQDEWITPVAFWELDASTGLYMPPGISTNPKPPRVQIYGNRIETQTVVARQIRTSNVFSAQIAPPSGAKGFVAMLDAYGITGTFAEGQGIKLRVPWFTSQEMSALTDKVIIGPCTTTGPLVVIWYPGISKQDYVGYSRELIIGLPLAGLYRFDALIDGTFDTGQGIDCSITVHWLYA